MGSGSAKVSAFDQGKKAASGSEAAPNPFARGSAEYNNFELGRRFGADRVEESQNYWRERPDASTPDFDETDDDTEGTA